MSALLKKLSISIKINVVKHLFVWTVYKLSTESVSSHRELVANCVHTADATQQNRFVASAVFIGHKTSILNWRFNYNCLTQTITMIKPSDRW